jgi:hypothetical protein
MLAKIFIINSGSEVPNATIVKPITSCESPRRKPIEEAPLISNLAATISTTKPRKNNI